jgi:predicted AlkP superfamily pyrophosphatase or phosphodiesterase
MTSRRSLLKALPLAVSLSVAALLSACAGTSGTSSTSSGPVTSNTAKPRLIVFLVVDGLPMRQVVNYREQFGEDGFRRFLDKGTWFEDAHYAHAYTVTAAGHSVMLTGTYPYRTGIIGNEWRDPLTGQAVYCTGDEAHTYIGHKTNKLDGTSPKNLRVETVGDVLKRGNPMSKVIGISGKDRGAILPAGKSGTAYMYMGETGSFASTTYYMKEHPPWVTAFNNANPANAFFKKNWEPMLGEDAYKHSVPDGQKWFASTGGGKLPMTFGTGDKPGANFYGGLLASPYGDELTLAFARAAVEGEALGQDDNPDILSVSLSSHDYVNHAFGAESRISHDHMLHLDRHLQAFFRYLDARIGKDNYVAALTADHGFMPTPEWAKTMGYDGGRINSAEMGARVNTELGKQFGDGRWVLGISANGVVLNHKLLTEKGVDKAKLSEEARKVLAAEAGVFQVTSRAELAAGKLPAGTRYGPQLAKSFHPDLSPDLILVLKPHWMIGTRAQGTTHGSPFEYDTHVPILFYGPRWVAAAKQSNKVQVADIAPTLSHVLGVAAPSASEGKVLPLGK